IRDFHVTGVQTCALPIYASSRATVADGTWRKKRGVSDELVATVEAELRQGGIAQIDAANEAIAEMAGTTDAQTVEVPEAPAPVRSEERRVGKECSSRWAV